MNKNSIVPGLHPFFNRTGLFAVSLSLALLLTACGSPAAAPRSLRAAPAQAGTDVAATLTARSTATATATAAATATATPTETPTATSVSMFSPTFLTCNNLDFVGDVSIPDRTLLAPGQRFTKTWAVENIGSCHWTPVYSLRFISGDRMGGVKTEIGQTVNPNERTELSVELNAPNHEGTYVSFWRLADQYGKTFGQTLELAIVVEKAALTPGSTVTPTATIISFGAPAAGSASTAAPTASTPGSTTTPTP